MLSVNDKFPNFSLKAAKNHGKVKFDQSDLKGSWSIVFFYPEDYSFICPTEVQGFNRYVRELKDDGTNLIGISIDDVDTHIKWAEKLDISYPLGSDPKGKLAEKVGVLDHSDNRAHRATFILDPDLVIHFAMISSRNVGRSVEETMRVYRAIQTGRKCPADYKREK